MLWFGRQPQASRSAESRSEDAASEMEVASTGHRLRVSPEASAELPGGEELDEALAGLDAVGWQRASTESAEVPRTTEAAEVPRKNAEPAGISPAQLGEPSGPASRAYRRLRRIFPG